MSYHNLIRWIILCEAEKGLKGLSKRIATEWGDLAEQYGLKKMFNEEFKKVRNEKAHEQTRSNRKGVQ